MPHRAKLQDTVERRHKCKARLIATEPVFEEFDTRPPWAGVVYHFVLDDHPSADLAFAWVSEGGKRLCYAVLRKASVVSAADAVRKVMLAEYGMFIPAHAPAV